MLELDAAAVTMRKIISFLLWQAALFSAPLLATEPASWSYDSIAPPSLPTSADQISARAVAATLNYMLERWNAHDLEGYLSVYWKSNLLFYIVDGQQIVGWQDLYDSFKRGYRDLRSMGNAVSGRVRIRLLNPTLAFAVTNWSLNFPSSNHVVVGVDTVYLQLVESQWKIISSHTSTLEM